MNSLPTCVLGGAALGTLWFAWHCEGDYWVPPSEFRLRNRLLLKRLFTGERPIAPSQGHVNEAMNRIESENQLVTQKQLVRAWAYGCATVAGTLFGLGVWASRRK